MKPRCFIASPFRGEDELLNIDFARRVGRRVALETGFIPIVPHLLFPQLLNDKVTEERDLGISYARTLIAEAAVCLFALPSWRHNLSEGMLGEKAVADELKRTRLVALDGPRELTDWARLAPYHPDTLDDALRELALWQPRER